MSPQVIKANYESEYRSPICYRPQAHLIFAFVCLLTCAGATSAGERPDCEPTRDTEILKKREDALRSAATGLLQVLRLKDVEGFFKLVDEDYFAVGEGGDYTVAELREMFKNKDELYCHLFDSDCIPNKSPGESGGFLSFSELAQRTDTRVGVVDVWASEGLERPGCSGHVNIIWAGEGGVEPPMNITRFTFIFVHNRWKTVGIDDFVYIRRNINPPPDRKLVPQPEQPGRNDADRSHEKMFLRPMGSLDAALTSLPLQR